MHPDTLSGLTPAQRATVAALVLRRLAASADGAYGTGGVRRKRDIAPLPAAELIRQIATLWDRLAEAADVLARAPTPHTFEAWRQAAADTTTAASAYPVLVPWRWPALVEAAVADVSAGKRQLRRGK